MNNRFPKLEIRPVNRHSLLLPVQTVNRQVLLLRGERGLWTQSVTRYVTDTRLTMGFTHFAILP